jgi:hypothetical protein
MREKFMDFLDEQVDAAMELICPPKFLYYYLALAVVIVFGAVAKNTTPCDLCFLLVPILNFLVFLFWFFVFILGAAAMVIAGLVELRR